MLNRLSIEGIGGPKGQRDNFHSQAQGRMQHIHHRIDPGHVQCQIGDHMLRGILEIFKRLFRPDGADHKGIHGLVRQRNRLVHAADRSGGMKDNRRLPFPVGNGICFIFDQQIFHQQTARHLPEQLFIDLPDRFQHRDAEFPAHGAFQQNDVADAQQLPQTKQAPHQPRKRIILGNDQIGDLFLLNHAVDLILIEKIKGIDERNGRSRHVEPVKGEDRLCQGCSDQGYPRAVLARQIDSGKRRGISFPLVNQLTIIVRPIAVADRNALLPLFTAEIQFPDKRPAGLVNQLTVLHALLYLRNLFLFAFFHRKRPFYPLQASPLAFA